MVKAIKIIILFIFSAQLFAASSDKLSLQKVVQDFRNQKGVSSKLKKEVYSELLEEKTTSEGLFQYAKGKLRIEFKKPEAITMVMNKNILWVENKIDDPEFGLSYQVTKINLTKDFKSSNALFALIFSEKDLLTKMKLVKAEEKKKKKIYRLKPKTKDSFDEITQLEILVKNNKIKKISYWDDRENIISYELLSLKKKKLSAKSFKYKPPKGATINEI